MAKSLRGDARATALDVKLMAHFDLNGERQPREKSADEMTDAELIAMIRQHATEEG